MLEFVLPGEAFEHVVVDRFDPDEKCVFYMKRLTRKEERQIDSEHTERGVIDQVAVNDHKLQVAITGWEEGQLSSPSVGLLSYDAKWIPDFPDTLRLDLLMALSRARPTQALRKASVPS